MDESCIHPMTAIQGTIHKRHYHVLIAMKRINPDE
jgi:hypothetical protein